MCQQVCGIPSLCGYLEGEIVNQHWDATMIKKSLVVAACGAFTSLTVASHLKYCSSRFWYILFIGIDGMSIGMNTVWAMHFVGMQALMLHGGERSHAQAELTLAYEPGLTITSGIAAWIIAGLGLHLVAGRDVTRRRTLDLDFFVRLILASFLIATGICVMHYMGMLSQTGPVAMELHADFVVASVIVAIVASHAGLFIIIAFPDSLIVRLASAIVIALAVGGMHYTGMAAAEYTVKEKAAARFRSECVIIDGNQVALASLVLDIFVCAVCNNYGMVLRKVEEGVESQRTVDTAVASLKDFGYPMIVVPAPCFMETEFTSLAIMHEGFRAAGKLRVFDTANDVQSAKSDGDFIIFFSYECLRWETAGPNDDQFRAMKSVVNEVVARTNKPSNKFLIFLDCLSIPQRNSSTKKLAINSIYTYARMPDIMVIVCPESRHANTGQVADHTSVRKRLWCRLEHLAFYNTVGSRRMFLHCGGKLECLPRDWMHSVCKVFDGECTCCRLRHTNSEECDRKACVVPLLALYYDKQVQKMSGTRSSDDVVGDEGWELISKFRKQMFPNDFTYMTPMNTIESRVLFGDMLERIDKHIASHARLEGWAHGGRRSQRGRTVFRDILEGISTHTSFTARTPTALERTRGDNVEISPSIFGSRRSTEGVSMQSSPSQETLLGLVGKVHGDISLERNSLEINASQKPVRNLVDGMAAAATVSVTSIDSFLDSEPKRSVKVGESL